MRTPAWMEEQRAWNRAHPWRAGATIAAAWFVGKLLLDLALAEPAFTLRGVLVAAAIALALWPAFAFLIRWDAARRRRKERAGEATRT